MRFARSSGLCFSSKTVLPSSGFTLIEMLITVAIFALIASSILANYPKFSQQLAIDRTAQEVALSFREAKTYALAVREFGIGSGIFPGYGVHFDLSSPKSFLIFADYPYVIAPEGDHVFNDTETETVERFTIQSNAAVSKICGNYKTSPPGDCNFRELDVVYLRPDPTVYITGIYSTGSKVSLSDAGIFVAAPNGTQKIIELWSTGQVSVE